MSNEKTATFTLGLPGSGKTTFLRTLFCTDYRYISADEIRLTHPMYDPLHPELIHDECVAKAEEMVYELANRDGDIIMDGGGINNSYTARIINNLRDKGYKIIVYFINTPVNICIDRNNERVEKSQRFVPISVIIDKSYRLMESVVRLKFLADEFHEIKYYTDKNMFVDMDGVVAEYQDLPLDEDGNINFVSHHIFRNAKPVNEVIDKLRTLCDNGHNLYILSASPNSICNDEKINWLKMYMPFINQKNIYFVGNKDFKSVMIKDLMAKLKLKTCDCTLIDDEHSVIEKVKKIKIRVIHPSKFLANF